MSVSSFSFNYHSETSTVKFLINLYASIEDAIYEAELTIAAELIVAAANKEFYI